MRKALYLSLIAVFGIANVDMVCGGKGGSMRPLRKSSISMDRRRLSSLPRTSPDLEVSMEQRLLVSAEMTSGGDSGVFSSGLSSFAVSENGSPITLPLADVNTIDDATNLGIEAHDMKEPPFKEDISEVLQDISGRIKHFLDIINEIRVQQGTETWESRVKLAGKVRALYLYVQKQITGRQASPDTAEEILLLKDIFPQIQQLSEHITEMCQSEFSGDMGAFEKKLQDIAVYVIERMNRQ